jgi:hypothetical protein
MEVYVVQRPFKSFGAGLFKRLPPSVNDLFVDVGVCHYLTIFKTPSGQLVQFDFGPRGGGDISLGPADRGRMARLFKKNKCRAVPAEIREEKLGVLPEAAMPCGKTNLTLQQVRTFNEAQRLEYEVHKSDCRHYVDRLVRYSTGKERAAAATAKWSYALKRQRYRWTAGLTMATDVQYYNHLKLLGQASVASLAMFTNRGKISRLWTPRVAGRASKALVVKAPGNAMLKRTVLPTAAAGVAAAAWADAPVIRNVVSLTEGVKRAASRSFSWMGHMAKGAGSQPALRLPFSRRPTMAMASS